MTDRSKAARDQRRLDIVRWGPVVAGAVIGLAVFVLLDTLWLAGAASGDGAWVRANLSWLLVASAALALLLTGVLAGSYAGVRGPLAGVANGVTAWGLLLVLAATAVVPRMVNPASTLGVGTGSVGGLDAADGLWTLFWSLLVGLVLAAVGGLLGGLLRRPVIRDNRNGDLDGDSRHRGIDGGSDESMVVPGNAAASTPPDRSRIR